MVGRKKLEKSFGELKMILNFAPRSKNTGSDSWKKLEVLYVLKK
jgi:hypothetical protein